MANFLSELSGLEEEIIIPNKVKLWEGGLEAARTEQGERGEVSYRLKKTFVRGTL
jgi:hypothetical protein